MFAANGFNVFDPFAYAWKYVSRFGIYLCGVLGVFMIINVVCNAFHVSFVVVVVVVVVVQILI